MFSQRRIRLLAVTAVVAILLYLHYSVTPSLNHYPVCLALLKLTKAIYTGREPKSSNSKVLPVDRRRNRSGEARECRDRKGGELPTTYE
jgi:hypothetical protein